MKLKIDFGKGGLKGFLVQHAEKGIFGVVLILVAVFIYTSATQEEFKAQLPQDLQRQSQDAGRRLAENHWEALAPERETKVSSFPQQALIGRKPIDSKDYTFMKAWDKEMVPRQQKRRDPAMFAPEKVEAEGGLYAVAIRVRRAEDPFADDTDAVAEPEKEKKKPRRRRKPKRRPAGGSGMYGSDMYGMEEGDEGMMSTSPEYSSGGEMGSGEMGYGEMSGTGVAGGRQLGSFYRQHYLRGFKANAGGPSRGGPGVVARGFGLVAVKALVPYEKQWEEYEKALAEATGYSPQVDIPNYLYFIAERADVDPSDPDAEPQWKTISNSQVAVKATQLYAGMPQEIADGAYLLPGVLTMPMPPILVKSYESLAVHSEIPKRQAARVSPSGLPLADEEEEEGTSAEDQLASGVVSADGEGTQGLSAIPTIRPGRTPGYGSDGGMYGSDPEMGGSGMYGSDPEMGGSGMYGSDPSGSGTGSPYGQGYSMEGGMESGGMGYGGGEYGMGGGRPQPVVKYKMIRFFDFSAKPGNSYRYRVRVGIEDPNHPRNPQAEPNTRLLDQSVTERLATVQAEEQAMTAQGSQAARKFYIETDWSEPSNVVTIKQPEEYVAGEVQEGRIAKMGAGVEFAMAEKTGKLVTMVWDQKRSTEVAAERDVLRGAYLDFKQKVDVLHPLTLRLKTIEEHSFGTDAFLVDMRGGHTIITDVDEETDEKTTLYSPGEFLVIDGKGNLIACDEVDDAEEYRRLMFIEDKPASATFSMGDPSAEEDYEAGYGGMYGESGGRE